MPTATPLYGYYLLSNLSPLTTTLWAPAYVVLANVSATTTFQWYTSFLYANCYPDGKIVQSIVSDSNNAPVNKQVVLYNSPGSACSAVWKTVGVAAKYANGTVTLTSSSGAFRARPSLLPTSSPILIGLPLPQMLVDGLDVGEAALCCPSNFTAVSAHCYSTLPQSVSAPGTYTIGGSTVTAAEIMVTAAGSVSVATTTSKSAGIRSSGRDYHKLALRSAVVGCIVLVMGGLFVL
ncbi:hypothetical protein SEUCBS140593_010591 [Sporothrix eucalyptigena]|uniref:Uncharacterized protein n=1 Tax=Sporothrix eucalyptigena TaxID=1812306 RepID=A0ABP0D1S5_9PEZI